MRIRVVLIDDDHLVHSQVAELLQDNRNVALVGQAYRGDDAVAVCHSTDPDIVLMDVNMPGMPGADATRLLLESFPDIKVLTLSSHTEHEHILAMLNSGAIGYLTKDALADDLLETLLMTYQGNTVLSPSAREALISPPPVGHEAFNLTARELDVVRLMGQGLTNRQIAADLAITTSTVSFHLNNILEKMALQTRSEVLVVAAKAGLI